MQFWAELIRAMIRAHLSIDQLAAAIDVTPKTIEHWRAGRVLPTPMHYSRLYDTLSCRCDHDTVIDLDMAYAECKADKTITRKDKLCKKAPTKMSEPKWDGETYIF